MDSDPCTVDMSHCTRELVANLGWHHACTGHTAATAAEKPSYNVYCMVGSLAAKEHADGKLESLPSLLVTCCLLLCCYLLAQYDHTLSESPCAQLETGAA